MPSLYVKLLGGFEVRDGAGVPVGPLRRQSQAVLAVLALSPGVALPRDKLAALLWSERGESQARGGLRHVLRDLRKALADLDPLPLITDRETAQLDPNAVEVDAVTFARLIDDGTPESLSRAAALYQGELLDGLGSHDAVFEAWLRDERARLHERARAALSGLLDQQMAARETDDALATAKRLLGLDPTHEGAHRALMRIYTDADDRALALKQYRICCEVLRAELGIEPEAATQQMHAEIRREQKPVTGALAGLPHEGDGHEPHALPDKPSIAVLPFVNMSGDPEQEFFADGITEDIITELSRFRDLSVISRNSSFSYKGKSVRVQNIGHDLGVAYVVEGSVRKSGNRLRITAQLVEVATGNHIWAERYDRELQDIFAVQDEIAQMISAVIAPEIGQSEQNRARRRPPQNLSAWEYYQRGLWHMYRSAHDDLIEARRLFESALERDPEFAAAYSALAYALLQEVMYSEPSDPSELLRLALDAARKGVDLDNHSSFAHFVRGRVHVMHHELEIACTEFEKAIDLNPSYAYPYFGLGIALLNLSRFEEALQKFRIAQRLSPRDPLAWAFIHYQAWPLLGLRRYAEAIALEREALRNPNAGFWPYLPLLAALGHLGRKDEAKNELTRLGELQPAYTCAKARRHLVDAVNPLIDQVIDGLRKAGLPE